MFKKVTRKDGDSMKHFTFINNGKTFERVSKATARKAFTDHKKVYICDVQHVPFLSDTLYFEANYNFDDFQKRGHKTAADYFNSWSECYTNYHIDDLRRQGYKLGKYAAYYIERT